MRSRLLTGLPLLLLVSACDQIGSPVDALGARPPAPDEFAVMKRRPLAMPPGLSLPQPQPGAPSPLDPNPQGDAALALLGPGGMESVQARSQQVTAGEAALLQSVEEDAADNRVALALDEPREVPYEPPTIIELLNGRRASSADTLDPTAEAQRLQRGGISAPNNPAATADTRPTGGVVLESQRQTGPEPFGQRAPHEVGRY